MRICTRFKRADHSSSSRTMIAPPRMSEWPPMYLVVACMTMSAPNEMGFCKMGVAIVLSTATFIPCECAREEIA